MGAELIADHASTVIVLLGFALGAQKEFNIFPIDSPVMLDFPVGKYKISRNHQKNKSGPR
jgi:hypothetical protein